MLVGALLVVIALRGTQDQVFPWFFGNNSSSSSTNPHDIPGTKTPNPNCGTLGCSIVVQILDPIQYELACAGC